MVAGLTSKFGANTASSVVKPSLLLVRAFENAVSAGLPAGPEVDVRDFVPVPDERFTDEHLVDFVVGGFAYNLGGLTRFGGFAFLDGRWGSPPGAEPPARSLLIMVLVLSKISIVSPSPSSGINVLFFDRLVEAG
jgi:hypothetical protein